ncbi:unnamed protein product, partial [Bubo scandiacus]
PAPSWLALPKDLPVTSTWHQDATPLVRSSPSLPLSWAAARAVLISTSCGHSPCARRGCQLRTTTAWLVAPGLSEEHPSGPWEPVGASSGPSSRSTSSGPTSVTRRGNLPPNPRTTAGPPSTARAS